MSFINIVVELIKLAIVADPIADVRSRLTMIMMMMSSSGGNNDGGDGNSGGGSNGGGNSRGNDVSVLNQRILFAFEVNV